MLRLTKRQTEIYDLICNYIESNGTPPTRAEIAKKMGFKSPNAAEDHLKALAKKGKIHLIPGTSRGIRVNQSKNRIPTLKLPKEANEIYNESFIDREIHINPKQFATEPDFAVIASNDFPEYNITEGDLLICSNTLQGENLLKLSISNNQLNISKTTPSNVSCIGVIRKLY